MHSYIKQALCEVIFVNENEASSIEMEARMKEQMRFALRQNVKAQYRSLYQEQLDWVFGNCIVLESMQLGELDTVHLPCQKPQYQLCSPGRGLERIVMPLQEEHDHLVVKTDVLALKLVPATTKAANSERTFSAIIVCELLVNGDDVSEKDAWARVRQSAMKLYRYDHVKQTRIALIVGMGLYFKWKIVDFDGNVIEEEQNTLLRLFTPKCLDAFERIRRHFP